MDKLKILFDRKQRDYLEALGRVAEYRIPPVGTTNPSGTANALINHMARAAGSVAGLSGSVGTLIGLRQVLKEGAVRVRNAAKVQEALYPLSSMKARGGEATAGRPPPPQKPSASRSVSRLIGLTGATEAGAEY